MSVTYMGLVVVVGERVVEWRVAVHDHDTGETFDLEHHVHHSPDGFSWGYAGSGPSELARCILWHHLGAEPHPACYQVFKFDVVVPLDGDKPWELKSEDVDAWLTRFREHGGQVLVEATS